jgi:hypothetical protein
MQGAHGFRYPSPAAVIREIRRQADGIPISSTAIRRGPTADTGLDSSIRKFFKRFSVGMRPPLAAETVRNAHSPPAPTQAKP